MRIDDELEQAFRQGYVKGYKAADKGRFINGLRAMNTIVIQPNERS